MTVGDSDRERYFNSIANRFESEIYIEQDRQVYFNYDDISVSLDGTFDKIELEAILGMLERLEDMMEVYDRRYT